ncbi:SAM-dependent methyltransferase [Streptomyces sp. NPDC059740]|uniref:SAM-dependent methyltransferase n=1 Tax=Streptomyces sp. NPDC059740 TaxID=3346926 RepID=UPI0036615000
MTPTLVRHDLPRPEVQQASGAPAVPGSRARARDWAEIQERMLVPLYDAVYDRLDVGPRTRLLGLGCGSGLALVMAAGRGARVSGVDGDEARLELARVRLQPDGDRGTAGAAGTARLACGGPDLVAGRREVNLVTAFHPAGWTGPVADPAGDLTRAARLAERGACLVLGGWGPEERCAVADVVRVADRMVAAATGGSADGAADGTPPAWRPGARDELEELAAGAGLLPDGSGRVSCPFGYADLPSAVRGMLSTGLFDRALELAGPGQVEKEVAEALHVHRRPDGTVWMSNVFRYLIARTP